MGVVVVAATTALVGCTPQPDSPAPPSPVVEVPLVLPDVGPPAPAHGAYFGAWVMPDVGSPTAQIGAVDDLEQRLGRPLAVVHVFRRFTDPFPRESDLHFVKEGQGLLLSWNGTDTRVITSGAEDAAIRTMALAVKSLHAPIWLRFRWEMNRPNLQATMWSPEDYIAAWKHLRAIFTEVGATNAAWVWCPLASDFMATNGPAYYPGDDQVDWLCADVYPYQNRQFADVIAEFMTWAKGHPQPIMIGEFGANEVAAVDRATWLTGAFDYVESQPRIKAMVYFEGTSDNGASFKLLPGSPELAAVTEGANRPYFDPLPPDYRGGPGGNP